MPKNIAWRGLVRASAVAQKHCEAGQVLRYWYHGASVNIVYVMKVVTVGSQVQLGDDDQHQQVHDLMGVEPVIKQPWFSPVLRVEGCEPALGDARSVDAGCCHAGHLQFASHVHLSGMRGHSGWKLQAQLIHCEGVAQPTK